MLDREQQAPASNIVPPRVIGEGASISGQGEVLLRRLAYSCLSNQIGDPFTIGEELLPEVARNLGFGRPPSPCFFRIVLILKCLRVKLILRIDSSGVTGGGSLPPAWKLDGCRVKSIKRGPPLEAAPGLKLGRCVDRHSRKSVEDVSDAGQSANAN